MDLQDYLFQENLGDITKFPFKIETITLKKGTMVVDIGEISKNIYFIVSGKIEAGMITPETTKIIDFIFEGNLFTPLSSLLNQSPNDVYHQCLTKCVLQVIPYDQLSKACETSVFASNFLIHFLKSYYLLRVQKEKDLITKDASQRYIELMKNKPEIIQDIPILKIAKYLGIHPYSLSRIRSIALKKKL
jgi:CRP-like cAMP-binding protein